MSGRRCFRTRATRRVALRRAHVPYSRRLSQPLADGQGKEKSEITCSSVRSRPTGQQPFYLGGSVVVRFGKLCNQASTSIENFSASCKSLRECSGLRSTGGDGIAAGRTGAEGSELLAHPAQVSIAASESKCKVRILSLSIFDYPSG